VGSIFKITGVEGIHRLVSRLKWVAHGKNPVCSKMTVLVVDRLFSHVTFVIEGFWTFAQHSFKISPVHGIIGKI
jgi:hypothetical protein